MFKAKNFKHYVTPKSELTVKELKKVLSCLDETFTFEELHPKKGTFILEHQTYDDKDTSRIVEFEFEGGKKRNFLKQGRDSRLVAENMIGDAATFSKNPGSAIRYGVNTSLFMSLEATNGRFNAVYFADNGSFKDQIIVYCAISKSLSLVIPEDDILQKSWEKTYNLESDYFLGLRTLADDIEKHYRALS